MRMFIAIGAAEGIAYLHQTPHVIHRDIKASNILLDSDFQARVADFGFAKLVPDGATHVTTKVKGTLGYFAPEYSKHGKASESCDVYSFGIVLLELVSAKKPIEKLSSTVKLPIKEWALPLAKERKFEEIVDLKLKGKYDEEELKQMSMPEKRPIMTEVVDLLNGIPKEKLSSLENDMFEPETADDSCSSISEKKDSRANANDIDS